MYSTLTIVFLFLLFSLTTNWTKPHSDILFHTQNVVIAYLQVKGILYMNLVCSHVHVF